jgi:hypothetical protein
MFPTPLYTYNSLFIETICVQNISFFFSNQMKLQNSAKIPDPVISILHCVFRTASLHLQIFDPEEASTSLHHYQT